VECLKSDNSSCHFALFHYSKHSPDSKPASNRLLEHFKRHSGLACLLFDGQDSLDFTFQFCRKYQTVKGRSAHSMTEKKALQELVVRFPHFDTWEPCQQLGLIAWFLHTLVKKWRITYDPSTRKAWGILAEQTTGFWCALSRGCRALVCPSSVSSWKSICEPRQNSMSTSCCRGLVAGSGNSLWNKG
jgi:hypothetical protein